MSRPLCRGKLIISCEALAEALGLPDGVEIIRAMMDNENSESDTVSLILGSSKPIVEGPGCRVYLKAEGEHIPAIRWYRGDIKNEQTAKKTTGTNKPDPAITIHSTERQCNCQGTCCH